MGTFGGPNIERENLALILDAGSERSYPGNDEWKDLSGNDNDGTMYTGKCLDFDGALVEG